MIELVGDELYQWDVGRKVKITPKRGYTISCVHFNDGSDDSLTMVNGVATARIPDELLQQCGSVTVYAVSTKEGGIETTESRQFYIKKKTKPTGYTHVPTEVATINSAITAATQAQASAKEAEGYKTTAQTYASNARDSAKNASTSETNAKTYATNASNSAKNASTSETNAKTYATNASNSAVSASTSANSANAYKVAAENAKNEILGNGGTYSDPKDESALKEIRDSRDAIRSIESNMNTAVEAAGQIDSFRSEITTYRTETKNARDDILSGGADGEKSVYEKIIDAETSIIGSGGTVADPKEGSALRATKDAQKAAAQSAKEAKEAAASANQGIVVVDSLEDTSTANALSANKGRVLNEKIANLNEIYIMKSGETEADVPKSVEVIIMPEESGTPYILTDSDKSEIASLVKEEVPLVKSAEQPIFANSIDECTDTSKLYVLPDGYIYAFKSATTEQEVNVTDNIVGTIENPYETGRLSPGGTLSSDTSTHTLTPYIDLTKAEYLGKTIELHLEGNRYVSETAETYIQMAIYKADKSVINGRTYTCLDKSSAILPVLTNISTVINDTTSATLTIKIPAKYNDTEIGYMRFCGLGKVTDSVYITYTKTQTVTAEQWVNTGILYGGSGGEIDEATAAKISELNNEGADPETVKLLSAPVLEFYNSEAYSDNDYTVSHLSKIIYPCRADMPVPYTVKWGHNENAMRTTVAIDTKAISNSNAYTMRTYDATGVDKYPIFNLLPNTTYYYKVTHVFADGSLVEAKSGSFTTSSESIRLIYIDGTQNVRDLGGWTGLNGKKVKYGKIFRGAAFSDSSYPGLMLTGKGRLALGELKIQAELNLGAVDSETSIAPNVAYKKVYYTNYAIAITDETYRTMFKTLLEYIVSCLDGTLEVSGLSTVARNIYMHCQGGCDRTGTLSFLLLGLLGVSESDLAKEYELSSFSDVGFGRLRTTTKAVDTYDYVGMVEALKTYSGDTITDKFVSFATTGCGISIDTITSFRNLMLE